MKKFLIIFTGSIDSKNHEKWNQLNPDERKQKSLKGMIEWQSWAEKNSSIIIDHGGPLGTTTQVNISGSSQIKNQMSAYTIIQAESYELASNLFINHPHFSIFPGDGVEIMEILPIPEM